MLGQWTTMEHTVLSTLSACLSPDPNIRTAAEQCGKELARQQPDYGQYLTHIAVTQTFPIGERQLAAVTLKQYVDAQWQNKGNAKAQGPETPEEVKANIRASIIVGIADPVKQIRVLSAYVISRIAHFDWPENWPNLFDIIMDALRDDANKVHGAMRILAEFVRDDLTDQHFQYIAPALLPELHRIFSQADAYRPRDRSRALAVFRDFSAIVFMVSDQHPQAVANYLDPVLPMWMDTFQQILAHPDTPAEALPVKHEVLRTLCKLVKQFPKSMSSYIARFLEPVWKHLLHFQPRYLSELVNPPDDVDSTEDVDSDGEVLGFESLLYSLLEFVQLVARKRSFRHLFSVQPAEGMVRNAGQFLTELVDVCLTYYQITADLEEKWTSDMNQYIQDNEEDALVFNVRVAVDELMMALSDGFQDETLQALTFSVQKKLQESSKAREAGDKNWWKVHEVCLLALGQSSETLVLGIRDGTLAFDLEGLFNHVVLSDMQCNECPFLQGRSLWFASQFADALPPNLITQYLGAAVQALGPAVTNAAVKISAVKALRGFCSTVDSSELVPYQAGMIQGILGLSDAASDEALGLLLETLDMIVKVNEEVTARYVNVIAKLLIHVWVRSADDFVLSEIVTDLFKTLAENKFMVMAFQEQMIPVVRGVIREENVYTTPAAAATALDFMTSLIKHAPEPLPPIYTSSIFPEIIQLLLVVDDHAILQNGQDTIKELVQRDLPGLMRWSDGSKSGMDYIIALVSKLLRPGQSESASIFVGNLITKLIQKGGDSLLPILPDLLTAVVRRLEDAKTSSFIQQLVMVFAHLFIRQTTTTLDFLASLQLQDKTGLQLVLSSWCDHFTDFQGYQSIKVSAIAMSKVLRTADPRLNGVVVKGDEIVTSHKIVTRSMTQKNPTQYTMIPFPANAIKLLLVEVQHQSESRMGRPSARGSAGFEDDEGELDESWESGDEEDESWEDVAGGDPFLSGLMADGPDTFEMGEYDDTDPELLNEPLYQTDLKTYLIDLFKQCVRENTAGFGPLCDQYLNETEKQNLRALTSAP
ncbi:armadillo-type protein [Powellomyces hirtus]|nr:armadillo-type protein [Powellomyces hirtus]